MRLLISGSWVRAPHWATSFYLGRNKMGRSSNLTTDQPGEINILLRREGRPLWLGIGAENWRGEAPWEQRLLCRGRWMRPTPLWSLSDKRRFFPPKVSHLVSQSVTGLDEAIVIEILSFHSFWLVTILGYSTLTMSTHFSGTSKIRIFFAQHCRLLARPATVFHRQSSQKCWTESFTTWDIPCNILCWKASLKVNTVDIA